MSRKQEETMAGTNKWRELYDSYSEQYRATLGWDDFMLMPEAVRENLIPLTYEEMEKEYPDVADMRFDNCDYDDAAFELDCKIQRDEINALKEVYDNFSQEFKDFMSLGDFLA